MKEKKIRDQLGNELHMYMWDNVKEPKGVVQIVHGVNEHGNRYDVFAKFLNQNGYVVYMHDQISQGLSRTDKDKEYGTVNFGEKGIENLKNGVAAVTNTIKIDYDNLDIYAFGHSMGALVLRACLIDGITAYKKVILSGTGLISTKGTGFALIISSLLTAVMENKPSNFFDNQFRKTQEKINEKVKIDHFIEYLTRDKSQNEIDKNDTYLYIRLSMSAYYTMFKLIRFVNNLSNNDLIKDTNHILLISGAHDPAVNFGEDTKNLVEFWNTHAIDTELFLNHEGRHDSLHETNKTEIFEKIISFIES